MTTTISASEAAANQTDDALRAIYVSLFCGIGSSLRDANGNLRGFTAEEEAFRTAVRTEYKSRGLWLGDAK